MGLVYNNEDNGPILRSKNASQRCRRGIVTTNSLGHDLGMLTDGTNFANREDITSIDRLPSMRSAK